jgi:hypothetical protein
MSITPRLLFGHFYYSLQQYILQGCKATGFKPAASTDRFFQILDKFWSQFGHSYATQLLETGHIIRTIMELMGYENVNINTACCILIVMLFNLAGCMEI